MRGLILIVVGLHAIYFHLILPGWVVLGLGCLDIVIDIFRSGCEVCKMNDQDEPDDAPMAPPRQP